MLLQIVKHLTHRPVVKHRVIHCTIRQFDNAFLCAHHASLNILNDVVDHKVSRQISHLAVFFKHSTTERYLLQCDMQVLMQDQATHLGLRDDRLQERTTIYLVDTIGVCRRTSFIHDLSSAHQHHARIERSLRVFHQRYMSTLDACLLLISLHL